MQKLLISLLILLSLKSYSQLNKEFVEKEFPLLQLPHDNRGLLFMSYNIGKEFNPQRAKFIKANITKQLQTYESEKLNIQNHSSQYAIGRLELDGKIYVVYFSEFFNPKTSIAENKILITALNSNYQPIQAHQISYYRQEFKEEAEKKTIQTDHIFSELKEENNKLFIKLISISQLDQFPGDIHLKYDKKETYHHFDDKGQLIEITK